MDQSLPQLLMRVNLRQALPELANPNAYVIHTEDERSPGAWAWIISAAFERPFSYRFIRDDAAYAPERVFFARDYSQDAATACAFFRDEYAGEGYVHMVGTHPYCRSGGAGALAVRAALSYFQEAGYPSAVLTTDDFRLCAIATYKKLGFLPVMNHESAPARWAAVEAALSAYRPLRLSPIPLWPGKAPFSDECGAQAQPSLAPFPVEGARGVVVVCPGGGYTIKAHHEGEPIARMLNAAGVAAYVLDYRVTPCPPEAPLSDALRAIRLVRSLGYEKVGILGFSAGGHLCACAATHWDAGEPNAGDPVEACSSRPDAFAPCYPLISLVSFRAPNKGSQAMLDRLLSEPTLRTRYSAELHVRPDTPPAFLWHTANDPVVPVAQSLTLARALAAAGVMHELHVFADGAHGLGLAGGAGAAGEWPALCARFLAGQGFCPP